jgi:hypothetical protein
MASIPFMLTMRWGHSFERQARRGDMSTAWKRQHKDAIAVRSIGADRIDWDWEIHLARIPSDRPFIQETLFSIVCFQLAP